MATELFRKAMERAAAEFPEYEQDEFAKWLLDAIEADERNWEAAFARSAILLDRLESQALDEYKSGRAKLLDPDKL